ALALGYANSSFAQAAATAAASASIVAPVSITKNVDMAFGNIAVSGSAGTVVLSTSSNRTSTRGGTLPKTNGTVTSADFTVSGTPGYSFAITLPSSAATLNDGAGNSMTVDGFTSTPSSTGTISGSGSQDLSVGATLHVASSQPAGTYTSSTAV